MRLSTLTWTNLVFLQNRFQALLDEIIQQEEREMEQVNTFVLLKQRISAFCEISNFITLRDLRVISYVSALVPCMPSAY